MIKVWIVQDYNSMSIAKVFTTRIKAIRWVKSEKGYPNYPIRKCSNNDYEVLEKKTEFAEPLAYIRKFEVE